MTHDDDAILFIKMDYKLQLYRVGAYLAVHILLLSLFQPLTICAFWLSLVTLRAYLYKRISKIAEKGLIVYLPEKLQHMLRDRSLFDVMCDMWFTQHTSILKVLLKPFFVQVQPDRAVEVLDDLSPQMKDKMLTKGIVNIFPNSIKEIVSPEKHSVSDDEHKSRLTDIQLVPMKPIQSQEDGPSFYTPPSEVKERQQLKQVKRINFREDFSYPEEKGLNLSELSSQSSAAALRKSPTKIHQQWDQLSFYKNFRSCAHSTSREGIAGMIKTHLNMVKDLVELKKVSVQKISYKTLVKFAFFFMVAIVVQIRLHPKSRSLLVQILQVVIGVVSITGLFGAGAFIAYKNYIINKMRQENIRKIKND